jgi:hypothetical protein
VTVPIAADAEVGLQQWLEQQAVIGVRRRQRGVQLEPDGFDAQVVTWPRPCPESVG